MSIPTKDGALSHDNQSVDSWHFLMIDTSMIHQVNYIAKKPSWNNPNMFSQQKSHVPRFGFREILQETPRISINLI